MSKSVNFAAIDLGAESGRVVQGKITDDKLELIEQHRTSFENTYGGQWKKIDLSDRDEPAARQYMEQLKIEARKCVHGTNTF